MPITGLDHLMLAVPDLEEAADAIAGSLGLRLERGAVHPDFGTANRTVRVPGLYLELITFTDRAAAVRRPVGERMADVLAGGGGWLSFVLGALDLTGTVRRLRRRGVPLDPPHEGRAVRPDGEVRRWWLAGHGTDFRLGRMPSVIEYEAKGQVDPPPEGLGYELRGVSRVDVATDDLAGGVHRFGALLEQAPEHGHDARLGVDTAAFPLPDGTSVRLLGPDTGVRPGLAGVALAVTDVSAAAEALAGRGVPTTGGPDGEIHVDPSRTAGARFSFREAA
ncbi:VOC family protein [Actinomadura verrucosospora]|uniref:VOC domain-containing protein n=1 Tax=Actinomadura verrucosospora TaxID=46165 RepID=A0A7D4A110_ACTVE|nr:VOC family protein [Actinomadura verrucosospora]QKG19885.1 hypothetical protein ACTIVE_1521 [Actinomadura verrucosospora]